jgi:hypothetical protein
VGIRRYNCQTRTPAAKEIGSVPRSAGGGCSEKDGEHGTVDLIVSWNFKHIVHYDKISGFQGVNLLQGYKAIRIHSPLEVV